MRVSSGGGSSEIGPKNYLRLGLDPRLSGSFSSPTIATVIPGTSYSNERLRYTNIIGQSGDGAITWDSTNAAFTLRAGSTYRFRHRYNLFYPNTGGGYLDLGLYNVTTGTYLKRSHARSQGVIVGDMWSANHQRQVGEAIIAPTVDTIVAYQHNGGWGSWASYWNAVASGAGIQLTDEIISGDNYIEVEEISTPAPPPSVGTLVGHVQGAIQMMDRATDLGDWILLDGRLKSSLSAAQQAVATLLGYGANIPDWRSRMPIGALAGTYALGSIGGGQYITQSQLPNATLSVNTPSIQIGTRGVASGSAYNMYSSSGNFSGSSSTDIVVGGLGTSSINGGVSQQPYSPPYRAINYFSWLGSAISPFSVVTRCVVVADNTSGQSIPNNATTNITNWSASKNTTNSFNAATGQFTAPRTAEYAISNTFNMATAVAASAGAISSEMRGAITRLHYTPFAAGTDLGFVTAPLGATISLNAGDVIRPACLQTSGVARSLNTGVGRNCLSITEINPQF